MKLRLIQEGGSLRLWIPLNQLSFWDLLGRTLLKQAFWDKTFLGPNRSNQGVYPSVLKITQRVIAASGNHWDKACWDKLFLGQRISENRTQHKARRRVCKGPLVPELTCQKLFSHSLNR